MKKNILFVAIVLIVIGCSKKTIPTSEINLPQQYALMDDKATKGLNLAKSACTSCHAFQQPYNHTQKDWDNILPTMYKKANLTDTISQNRIAYFIYNNLKKPGTDLPLSK